MIAEAFDSREYGKALREIMRLADTVNEYVDQHKPWELAKQESAQEQLHAVCSTCIEAFRLLSIYLKPILPQIASQVEAFLKVPPLQFADAKQRMGSHTIGAYSHLLQRINPEELQGLFVSPGA